MLLRPNQAPRRGSILPMVALCMIALIAMLALAIDIGVICVARCESQNVADVCAMAGARTLNGDSTNNYNVSAAPGNAITAATANHILAQQVQGNPTTYTTVNAYTFQSQQVKVEVGTYAYVYNDANPSTEGFQIQIPRTDTTEPYSAARSTITFQNNTFFARALGVNTFNTSATATAIHRPRDVMIVVDLSGSMRFQSLPGVPLVGSGGNTYAAASSGSQTRDVSMNPDPVFPRFGHYGDTSGAGLQGSTTYYASSGEYVDLTNISSTQNSGPPIVDDFYANAVGVAPSSSNRAFAAAASSLGTTPGGDDYLKKTLDTDTNYAQTTAQFNNNSTNTNPSFERQGYTSVRSTFNGYTKGPGYWGKTFWIWPPDPRGATSAPTSLTDTTYNWYNNGAQDWRQRFFVAVKTSNNSPSWIVHNSILFDDTGSGAYMKRPGSLTTVTENGVAVVYDFRINYAAILYWLTQSPNPFPSTLQAGRIRYYSAIPSGTDNTLNNRWWTTDPANLTDDERFWKEYIDFVLGYVGTGANTYNRFQNSVPISSLIGNGDYYTWSGSTVQISNRPQPQPASTNPNGPYQTGAVNSSTGVATGATTVPVKNLSTTPTANRHYVLFRNGTVGPFLITNSNINSLTITPALTTALANNDTVQIYSPTMDYNDNPRRPKHQYWFGPLTLVDWLGNYNLYTLVNNSAPHHWWPGNCHEAQGWACKVGVQSAIDDIKNNHPNDFVGMTFFSSPKYSTTGSGHHNRAVVPLGRNYQQLKDSLWFPPSTVTGTATEINPYDPDMLQVPRADGGTSPGMGFMIAYNHFSSSTTNLRFYASPQPQYRGDAGGLGRKGAQRLVIFETDGFPNTRSNESLSGTGADSYYPIRIANPTNLSSSSNSEWPNGGSYDDNEVFTIVQQICAQTTASPPGYSTTRKPALVQCIGFGSIFDPVNSATQGQTDALTFLQTVQFYGNTATNTDPASFPTNRRIYGTNAQRIAKMQAAFTEIMQSGVQVSLLQ